MDFIKLNAVNGRETIINRNCIQCVTDRIGCSAIFFGESDYIEVCESIEDIFNMLDTEREIKKGKLD